jgi:hypothetical protein
MKRTSFILSAILAMFVALAANGNAGDQASKGKNKYLIKSTHTAEQCLASLDEMSKTDPKLLDKFTWGCKSGDHTGYAVLEGESDSAVRSMLPTSARTSAKIEKVDKFTAEEIKAMHQQSMQRGE